MAVQITLRPISVSEYARMREAGILREDDRIELIAGEIRQMSPMGPLHAAIVRRLTALLVQMLGESAIVSVQSPIQLNDFSEPQPDIAVLRPSTDNYAQAHPTADDVLIVIEVADTTVEYDRKEKIPRYANASISEAWLVDISSQTIEQYTQPRQERYQNLRVLELGDMLTAQEIKGLQVSGEQVFGV
jgi:Uma2 family endonuclease